MKLIKTLLLVLCFLQLSISADTYDIISQLGSSARHIAVGNVDGFSLGADSLFENPAALYRVKDYTLNIFSSSLMWDTNYNSMALAGSLSQKEVWSAGFYELVMTNFEYTKIGQNFIGGVGDWYAEPIGNFDIKQSIVKVAYQYSHSKDTHYGLTSNFYSHKMIDCNGKGWDMDLGMITKIKQFEVSATLKNVFGNDMNFSNNAKEELPRQLQLSTYLMVRNLHIFPQISYQNNRLLYSSGVEYYLGFFPQLQFMAGYKSTLNNANDRASRWSAGIGLYLDPITFFYAFEKGDVINFSNQHYFSIEISV